MRIKNSTQRFEVFVRDMQESFWGDFQGRTRETLQKLLEADSQHQMAEYLGLKWHERPAGEAGRIDYRNGFYEREYITPLGRIRLRVSRTRLRSFLPRGMRALERRSPEVSEMIRQAFLRGISTRGSGPGGVAADRGAGERGDGLAAHAGAGSAGGEVPPRAAGR